MRGALIACMLGAILLAPLPALAQIPTFDELSRTLDKCPGASTHRADTVKGEVFAFITASVAEGSGNLLTLRKTLALSKDSRAPSKEYDAFARCASLTASVALERAGIRLIRTIPELEPEFHDRSFAFNKTAAGDSISAFQLARVRHDATTHIDISRITCNALFSIAFVVYPVDSLQPGFEPPAEGFKPVKDRFSISIDIGSKEVAGAIRQTSDAIGDADWISDKHSHRAAFNQFIKDNPEELWLWINLSSNEEACTARMSVREEPR
ncbi:MAG: hypothetical protein J0H54_11965 [Rhizobiales bacterium]|nr:hypothetical protein [Hyphomicrobiales bacterium]